MLFGKTLFVAIAGLSAMAFAAPIDQVNGLETRSPLAKDPCDGSPNHQACDRLRHSKQKKKQRGSKGHVRINELEGLVDPLRVAEDVEDVDEAEIVV